MKNIDDEIQSIRRKNLGILISEAGSQAELGNRLDVDSSYISQMNTGHRPIREKVSRRLESIMGKPLNWMDQESAAFVKEQPALDYLSPKGESALENHRLDPVFPLEEAPACGEDYLIGIPPGIMPDYSEGGVFKVISWAKDPALLYLIVQLEGGSPVIMKAIEHRDVLGAKVTALAPLIAGRLEDDPNKWLPIDQVEILGALSNPVEDPRFRLKNFAK